MRAGSRRARTFALSHSRTVMSDTVAVTNLGEDAGSTGPATDGKTAWQARAVAPALAKHPERREAFVSTSGVEVERLYTPEDAAGLDYGRDLGYPGEYPFTRGIQPTMYRGRFWTMRQYAGFGTAEETNTRFKLLLQAGQTGLSTAFDLPTQMGYDSDHAMAMGEVGRVGVAIDTLDDMRKLLDGIPLDRVSTSMTINATAAILLALYIAVADERGIPRGRISGTIQNDILKEYIARGTYIYPVEPSLRLITDIFAFCNAEVPRWNTISISGYHIREAGATAAQEIAFTFADAVEYVKRAMDAGLEVDTRSSGIPSSSLRMSASVSMATPTRPTSPAAMLASESYPICVGRSKAVERPVWPASRRSLKRVLVSSAVPKPAYWRMVQKRPRYMVGWIPRVNGYSPGNPRSCSGSNPFKSSLV